MFFIGNSQCWTGVQSLVPDSNLQQQEMHWGHHLSALSIQIYQWSRRGQTLPALGTTGTETAWTEQQRHRRGHHNQTSTDGTMCVCSQPDQCRGTLPTVVPTGTVWGQGVSQNDWILWIQRWLDDNSCNNNSCCLPICWYPCPAPAMPTLGAAANSLQFDNHNSTVGWSVKILPLQWPCILHGAVQALVWYTRILQCAVLAVPVFLYWWTTVLSCLWAVAWAWKHQQQQRGQQQYGCYYNSRIKFIDWVPVCKKFFRHSVPAVVCHRIDQGDSVQYPVSKWISVRSRECPPVPDSCPGKFLPFFLE